MITLTEATQLTGKSKSTLNRAIKGGKLSASRLEDDNKTYVVDPAELERVFGFQPNQSESNEAERLVELSVNAARAELLSEQVEHLKAQLADLRQDRDDWKVQASNQTLLLKAEQESSGGRRKLFGLF